MAVFVTRPAGGISLNAGQREMLADHNGKYLAFESVEQAVAFLKEQGVDETGLEFPSVPIKKARKRHASKKHTARD